MRIAHAAFDWGAEVALTSPLHQSGTDRIAEVAKKAKEFAYIINIQGDEPLIDPRLIDKLVQKLANRSQDRHRHGGTSVCEPSRRFFAASGKSGGRFRTALRLISRARVPSIATRRKDSSPPGHLRFSARRAASIREMETDRAERAESLEQLRALENGVKVHVLVTKHGSPGVDTPQDAKALEQKLARAKRGVSR